MMYLPQNGNSTACQWHALPSDLLKEIAYASDEAPFGHITCIAAVCKRWQKLVSENSFGAPLLKRAALQTLLPQTWLKLYRLFVRTPRILALDISGSMKDKYRFTHQTRQEVAHAKIVEICSALFDCIELTGILCVVFAAYPKSKLCYSIKEVLDFFSIEGPRRLQYAAQHTDLYQLFLLLASAQLQNAHLGCEATIISDFDCALPLTPFVDNAYVKMHVQCLNLGVPEATTDFQRRFDALDRLLVQEQFRCAKEAHRTAKLGQQKLTCQTFTTAGSRSAKKQHRPLMVVQSKKRSRNATIKAYDIPLTVSQAQVESWQPMLKRRRVNFHLY